MSRGAVDIPEAVVTPGKMFNYWSLKMKVAALLLALGLYIYFLLFIKTIYLKSKRLDHIMSMAMEAENMIQKVQTIDQNLASKMEKLQQIHKDY